MNNKELIQQLKWIQEELQGVKGQADQCWFDQTKIELLEGAVEGTVDRVKSILSAIEEH